LFWSIVFHDHCFVCSCSGKVIVLVEACTGKENNHKLGITIYCQLLIQLSKRPMCRQTSVAHYSL
jgi:hypothetical protein